jgi:outer membrane receptor protein involved in Fe transport
MRNARMACLTVILLLAPVAWSQIGTGTIDIRVEDSTGAVVAGATVNITHVQTGQTRQGRTNEEGSFRAPFLPIGGYTVSAESAGFKKRIISGLDLRVDQNAPITVLLEPGEVREIVEVTGVTPLLETNTASIGQVIDTAKILELPLNGRNAFALGLLAGNTTPVTGQGTNLPFVGGGGRFSSNEVMLDGADNNTGVGSGGNIGRAGIAYTPSVDAVAEFKVQTNNFSAEYGNSAGVVINATTRSGTNQIHGSVFEFLRNDKLDANNFFTNAAGQPKAEFRQNQPGGSLGGRILRNRTFFFADYEATRRRSGASATISDVPPASFRSGDFSSFSVPIFDPKSRILGPNGTVIATAFPSNRIPASQLNSTSQAIMGLVPLPDYGAPGAQSRNYFLQVPVRFNYDRWDARIDHSFSRNNNFFGRFSFGNQVSPSPSRFGAGQWIGGGATNLDFSRQLVLSDTHVFSPRVVNEFRFGFNRHNPSVAGTATKGVPFAKQNNLALFPFPEQGFPALIFTYSGAESGGAQFSQLGGGNSARVIENKFQWSDNLSATRGNHTLKVGADIRRLRIDTLFGTPFYGEKIFGSTFTYSSSSPGSGAPFADFLLGYPTTLGGTQMLDWGREREIYFGAYVQDDWKVSKRLTLNLGWRYDLFTQPVDARDLGSLFNDVTGQFQVPGKNGFSRAIVDGDHLHLAPRFGFAYQANSKFVVRGGMGSFYGMRDRNQQTTQFSNNFPNIPQYAAPPSIPSLTLAPGYTINTPISVLPSDPTLANYTAASPAGGTFRATDFHNAKFPYMEQANLTFQFQPKSTWVLEASFSAGNGKHLTTGCYNPNMIPFSAVIAGKTAQTLRPFPNISAVVSESASWGASYYRAAHFKIEKRFSRGLSFLANYTVAKNLERYGSGVCTFSTFATVFILDPYNPKTAKTYAALDVPQVFNVNFVYQLPWGPGRPWLKSGALSRVLGGWQINGIGTLRGGFPNFVQTNAIPATYANFNLPDRVSGVSMYLGQGPSGYLNPAAFRVPGTVPNVNGSPVVLYGNAAPAVIRGPGSTNLDFSLSKEFPIRERLKLQFRSEYFNLTNTPTFFLGSGSSSALTCTGTPGGPCTNKDFGTLSTGNATGRQGQFGLKLLF